MPPKASILSLCPCDVNFLSLSSLKPKSHSLKCKLKEKYFQKKEEEENYLEPGLMENHKCLLHKY